MTVDDERGGRGIEWGGLPSMDIVRVGAAVVLAALVSALGALILGEYQFEGWMPFGSGVLFGLIVAELVVEVGRRRSFALGVVIGGFVAIALVWAGWISSGRGLEPIPGGAWLAAVIGFGVAAFRIGGLGRRRADRASARLRGERHRRQGGDRNRERDPRAGRSAAEQ